jgi:hypothetical protein
MSHTSSTSLSGDNGPLPLSLYRGASMIARPSTMQSGSAISQQPTTNAATSVTNPAHRSALQRSCNRLLQ